MITRYSTKEPENELKKRQNTPKHTGFKPSNLSVLAYANNFTMWHYTTVDDTTAFETAGYLDNAVDMLRLNDLIIVNIDTNGTPATKFYIVTGNDGSSVTVTTYA